jgi:hypothetical protein
MFTRRDPAKWKTLLQLYNLVHNKSRAKVNLINKILSDLFFIQAKFQSLTKENVFISLFGPTK